MNPLLQVVLTALEIFLCSGVFFGWANLSKIFWEEDFFRCENVTLEANIECNQRNVSYLLELSINIRILPW